MLLFLCCYTAPVTRAAQPTAVSSASISTLNIRYFYSKSLYSSNFANVNLHLFNKNNLVAVLGAVFFYSHRKKKKINIFSEATQQVNVKVKVMLSDYQSIFFHCLAYWKDSELVPHCWLWTNFSDNQIQNTDKTLRAGCLHFNINLMCTSKEMNHKSLHKQNIN